MRKDQSDDDTSPEGSTRQRESWHGEKRSNEPHESSTDSEARLFRKSRGIGEVLCY